MTAYLIWTLTCDQCGEIFDPGMPGTRAEVRAQAAIEGWLGKAMDLDYCPRCRLKRRESVR